MSGRAARKRLAAVSLNGAGNLCDVAPSRFERFDQDEYFTIDAGWIIPALCCAVQVEGPILEPCAGRGHMVHELRALGFDVRAADLHAYPNSLVPDIKTGADIFELKSLADYRFVVTNLPYREQAAILAHLLPIAARSGAHVAVLARSEWSSAKARRALVGAARAWPRPLSALRWECVGMRRAAGVTHLRWAEQGGKS